MAEAKGNTEEELGETYSPTKATIETFAFLGRYMM
jgi:hypothetical protein